VELRCAGGQGLRCGAPLDGGSAGCGADDARITYEPTGERPFCEAGTVYVFDGAACVAYRTFDDRGEARCAGARCATLPTSQEACEQAHVGCVKR
jgi:hypothetical protein